eukprot:9294825-Lingulodinium_polyedra.AAC.1
MCIRDSGCILRALRLHLRVAPRRPWPAQRALVALARWARLPPMPSAVHGGHHASARQLVADDRDHRREGHQE